MIGAAIMAVASAAMAAAQGAQAQTESEKQSKNIMAQTELEGKEIGRQTAREAQLERENISDVTRRQKLAYMKGGVSLEGSPLLVMEETRRKGAENIDEIISSGGSGVAASSMEGRMKSQQTLASGRQAFMSGIGSALSKGSSIASSYGGK